MQHNDALIKTQTTEAGTLNTVVVPLYFHKYIRLLPQRIQLLGVLLLDALSFAIYFLRELLMLIYALVHYGPERQTWNLKWLVADIEQAGDAEGPGMDQNTHAAVEQRIYAHPNDSAAPRHVVSRDVAKSAPNTSTIPAPASKEPCRDGHAAYAHDGTKAPDAVDPRAVQPNAPNKSSTCNTTVLHNCTPSSRPICATQCAPRSSKDGAGPSQIALNCTLDRIYRFAPRSIITVGIDLESFQNGIKRKSSQNGIKRKSSQTGISNGGLIQLLRCGLEFTLSSINHLNIGVQFDLVPKGMPSTITLKYQPNYTVLYYGKPYIYWAETQFPAPEQKEYTLWVCALTFEKDYRLAIPNILCHEFAHLLGMRHWNAEWTENPKPVQFPPGEYDEKSIMGVFDHPAELWFHHRDVVLLQELYRKDEGDMIEGKRICNIQL